MNKLYEEMRPQNPYQNMMRQFEEFKKNFQGDPQAKIQQMLNSGQISQQQYNMAVQKANMIKSFFGREAQALIYETINRLIKSDESLTAHN